MFKPKSTKNIINNKSKRIPFLIYPLIIAILFFIFFLASCSLTTEEREVSGIDSISIGSSVNLIINQTGDESIRIEAAENIIPYVDAQVENGELRIWLEPINFMNFRPINCYVNVIDLEAITVASSATVRCDELRTENLLVEMASSSRGTLTVDVNDLDLNIASSADLTISGEAESQNIKVNSSGKLNAIDLISKDCKIEVSSSGSASINVMENLDVTVRSSARVNYKGNPKVNSDIASAGSLNQVGN